MAPENITLGAFIVGAILLLIALTGGGVKLFGAEVSGTTGRYARGIAGVAGTALIVFGLWTAVSRSPKDVPVVPIAEPVTEIHKKAVTVDQSSKTTGTVPPAKPPPKGSCDALQGKTMSIFALNADGVLAPNGLKLKRYPDGTYTFSSTVHMNDEPEDSIIGSCKDGHIEFTRERANYFVQHYSGDIRGAGSTLKIEGKFSHRHSSKDPPSSERFDWSAVPSS